MDDQMLQERREQLLQIQRDYADVTQLIKDFSSCAKGTTMIPYGKVAFVDASLKGDGEFFVALGAEYFSKMPSEEASAVITRRAVCTVIQGLLQEVEDELEIREIARKLDIFATIDHKDEQDKEDGPSEGEGAAVDIREEWTEEDASAFQIKKGRVAHEGDSGPRSAMPSPSPVHRVKEERVASPAAMKPIVKERIVERKPGKKVADPAVTATRSQIKESLFRRALRKDNAADPTDRPTMAPPE